jgi:hypothetical protein
MTDYYAYRLIHAYRHHRLTGNDYDQVAEHFGYGVGTNNAIKGIFNRMVKINAKLQDVIDYLNGNYLASNKALEYYIRFVGERKRQISACLLAEELKLYDVEKLKNMLRGMTALYPELVNYSDTYGLDTLSIY